MSQQYTSEKTSINAVTSIYTKILFPEGTEILDYGGGKYDTNAIFLKQYGVICKVYDPYNRTTSHNEQVLKDFATGAKVIVCANVLNVIQEDAVIFAVLNHIKQLLAPNGTAYIQIYEGDRTNIGKPTSKGYQRNQKAVEYKKYLQSIFTNISKKGNIYTIKKGSP